MKDNIKVLICFCAFIVFMVLAYIGYNVLIQNRENIEYDENEIKDESTKKLPKFELYNENNEKVNSTEFLVGKPIVINIWTSWCAYCDVEMEYFNDLYLKENDNVIFVMINATGDRDSKENAKKYIQDNDFSFDVYYDLKLQALNKLGVYSYPTTIFVDKEGYIDSTYRGMITKEKLQRKLESLK